MLKYIKSAFTYHWNLLGLLGGLGFAFLSGVPGVIVPLVLAAEVGYLAFLGTHPKYQQYVDAQEAKAAREGDSTQSTEILQRIVKSLPQESRSRYFELLDRCQRLRGIASDLKHPGAANIGTSLDSMQIEGLDRLLWIFLRLLFTEYSIARFLEQTPRDSIARDGKQLEARLAALDSADKSEHTAKVRRTLEDSLATTRSRLENYDRAQSNHEFVQLEIERLENKITSLAELAVNRQEPDYISNQIDQVTHSMMDTEKTMNDLQYVTGLDSLDTNAPPIMQPTPQTAG